MGIVGAEKSHEEGIEGLGKAPNFKVTETSRITVVADGTVLHDFVHFRATCTGPGDPA